MANRLEELEKEVKGLRRQLEATKKPSRAFRTLVGLGAVIVAPLDRLDERGKEVLEKKHYANEAERQFEEAEAVRRAEARKAAGLPPEESLYYED